MKTVLVLVLTFFSMQAFAELSKDAEACVENIHKNIWKLHDGEKTEQGTVGAACQRMCETKDGYAIFYNCLVPYKSSRYSANAIRTCESFANRQLQLKSASAAPTAGVTSIEDCKRRLAATKLKPPAYIEKLQNSIRASDLGRCDDYLSCIKEAQARGGQVLGTVRDCISKVPGETGGPPNRVNHQGVTSP